MFLVGDKVVYGRCGVMTVTDIREESVLGEKKTYYVLHPEGGGETSLTFVPRDNSRLVKMLQPIISSEELYRVIDEVEKAEDLLWIEDSRERNSYFKEIFESGDRKEILLMIRTISSYLSLREGKGKKGYLSDEAMLKKSLKRICDEFSAVMGTGLEETEDFVINRIKKQK